MDSPQETQAAPLQSDSERTEGFWTLVEHFGSQVIQVCPQVYSDNAEVSFVLRRVIKASKLAFNLGEKSGASPSASSITWKAGFASSFQIIAHLLSSEEGVRVIIPLAFASDHFPCPSQLGRTREKRFLSMGLAAAYCSPSH
jgi:hypothetical protein